MPEHCIHEHRLIAVEQRYDTVQEQLKKMEDKFDTKLDLILNQINKIAVLEEKHSTHSQALDRAFTKIGKLEGTIEDLDRFKNHTQGMAKMAAWLWSAMGISLGAVIMKVFGQ